MAKFMVIEKGKELKGNEREAKLKELEKINEEKMKYFFEDEAEEDKDEKKSKKNTKQNPKKNPKKNPKQIPKKESQKRI